MTPPRGWPQASLVISVEGIDAAGKSTLIACLTERFLVNDPQTRVFSSREFSGPIGQVLQSSLEDMTPIVRAYTFAAQRHAVVAQIRREMPDIVLWDRYVDSSVASRYADAMLGVDDADALLSVAQDVARYLPRPDLTLLLDLDPETALVRARTRAPRSQASPYGLDGLRLLREGFLKCAAADPNRFVHIDARRSVDEVCDEAMVAITTRTSV